MRAAFPSHACGLWPTADLQTRPPAGPDLDHDPDLDLYLDPGPDHDPNPGPDPDPYLAPAPAAARLGCRHPAHRLDPPPD